MLTLLEQKLFLLLQTLSKRNAESLVLPPHDTNNFRGKSPRSPRLPPDWGLSQSFSSGSSLSPLSSGANSPASSFTFSRPGTLHGLSKSLQCIKSPSRRKSVHNIPLSPLARTPSPSPMALSPTSQTPPSKLAIVAIKSGPSPSTLTLKHCPSRAQRTSLTSSMDEGQGQNVTKTTTTPRSQHGSVTKTKSSQSDPGKGGTSHKHLDDS